MTNDKLQMTNGRINVLGVPIDNVTFDEVKSIIENKLTTSKRSPFFMSTVNASFIVKAQNDEVFRNILQSETVINTCDGVSLQMASEFLSTCKRGDYFRNIFLGLKIGFIDKLIHDKNFTILPNRITGVDITKYILKISNKQKLSILIVNRPDGLTSKKEILDFFELNYSNIKIHFLEISNYRDKLKNVINCDVFLCLLGEGKQEYFISNNKDTVRYSVAIGIGSTLDVLTGNIKTIPTYFKNRGLEWFFRLIYNPKRLKKIFLSVCYFPYLVYMSSLKSD